MTDKINSFHAVESSVRKVYLSIKNDPDPIKYENLTEDELWSELVSCILGNEVKFEIANSTMEKLRETGLLCHKNRLCDWNKYENDVNAAILDKQHTVLKNSAKQIRQTAEYIYRDIGSIRKFLGKSNVIEVRRHIVEKLSLCPKQSSLFLRNVSYETNIAVLDVHILKYMHWAGLTDTLVKSVSKIKNYEIFEKIFITHAHTLQYDPDRFDVAIWVVMKVASS